jgi:cytosine/adenosine deaminase-related metal-dependent hydrolase
LGGARAIGRSDLGRIAPGSRADIVLVDLGTPALLPVHDLVSNLVFCNSGANVHTVFVDGRKVLDGGVVTGIDETALGRAAQNRADVIRDQLGLNARQIWPVE